MTGRYQSRFAPNVGRTGRACNTPIALSGQSAPDGSVRLGMVHYNSPAEIERAVEVLRAAGMANL